MDHVVNAYSVPKVETLEGPVFFPTGLCIRCADIGQWIVPNYLYIALEYSNIVLVLCIKEYFHHPCHYPRQEVEWTLGDKSTSLLRGAP